MSSNTFSEEDNTLLITLILAAICVAIYQWWSNNKRYYELGSKIPGPMPLPIIGNAHFLIGKTHIEAFEELLKYRDKYGHIGRLWMGLKLFVFLTHPEDIRAILSSRINLDKSDDYRFLNSWLGNGLFLSSDQHWRHHRKIIAPIFHKNILKTFVGVFYENALLAVDSLEKEIGKEFDVYQIMSETTINVLLETVMGIEKTAQNNKGYEYAMSVKNMCDIIQKRMCSIKYRCDKFYNYTEMRKTEQKLLATIFDLTSTFIREKNEQYDKRIETSGKGFTGPSFAEIIAEKNSNKSQIGGNFSDIDKINIEEKYRTAFLNLMVETAKSRNNLSDKQIRDEVNTIMFTGCDTTITAASFTLCLLGVQQHIQDKVYQELHEIFGDSDRAPTFADTLEMKYLERVILESLRLYPPVPVFERKLCEDAKCATKGYLLPKGCTVVIGTYMIHRQPEFYPNPDEFNPDNFLPENAQKRHFYSFIPFSAGIRSCIGQEYAMLNLKILLSTVLRNFKVKSNVKQSDFQLQFDITLKRADGFRIEIDSRKK